MSKRAMRSTKNISDPMSDKDIVSQAFVLGLSLGSGAGMLFGLLWGSASGNVGAGLAIGMSMGASVGMSIGFVVGYAIRNNNEKKETQSFPRSRRRRFQRET